jgi:hypothetical protein
MLLSFGIFALVVVLTTIPIGTCAYDHHFIYVFAAALVLVREIGAPTAP